MNADEFRLRAESGEIPTVDPKLQTAARSGNRYAQREMERQMAAQQAESERQATIQARQAEMQAKQAARQAEHDAAELQAQNVRAAAAQGQKVVTDIETGKRSIATHPDGAPVYKTGPVGPQQITSIQPAGPTPYGGNIAPVTEVKQTYRNDRGETITSPVEQKTDAKTGETYVERKDAYGRPQRVTTGVDPHAQQKLQLEQESAKLDIHGNNLRAQRMQIEPRIKSVTDEWKAAETEWNKPPKFIQQDGKWVDPSNGMPADLQQVSDWQKSQVGSEARYRSAKRRYEQEAPALKNLDEQEKQLALRKLQIDTQRTALEHGLPAEDGGTAETITRQQTGQTNPAHDEVMRDLALVPGMGSVIDLANNDTNWQPPADATTPDVAAPTERPLMPTDNEGKRALFVQAFPALRNIDQYSVGKSEKGWTWIQRNGENIASIDADAKGEPAIVLNQNLVQQGGLRDTISLGVTTGIPIYLADNGKPKDQAAEAQYVASIFAAMRDDPAMQDQAVATARLKELGADPSGIMRAVNAGDLSAQRGEALMKNLYGSTLQASNPEDPATMQRWLQETKTRADKALQDKYGDPRLKDPNSAGRQWEAASTGIGTSATTKNQIRQDFLRDNYLENRGKPGVSRAKYLALHQQDLADSMTLGENVLSKLHAIGKSTRDDVLGSMIGLAGGATLSLGQAEAAILGSDKAAAQLKEDMRLRNRDFASWANSAARNIKAWTTPTGIRTAGAFDQSLTALQRAIDADEQASTPETQAAVTAAEQSARQAALAMHNLAPDESWPTTEADLDPARDTALASALNGYRTTADPRFFALYRDRMLMGNGRRQYSSELERKIGPSTGGFFSSMQHAMYAGWQEAGSEVIADTIAIASGGASKAIQAGLKGMGMTARATRMGKFSAAIAKGLSKIDEIGLAKNSLQRPLTGLQKGRNIAVQGIKGAIGEGTEEIMTEVGAESPDLLQAFGSGMLGVVGLSPAMIVSHFVGSTDMPQREMDQRNAKWASRYNATMAGTVGFQPITAADANVARTFVDPKAHQTLVDALTTQLEQITSAPEAATEQEAAARQQQRASIEQTLQQIATHTENAVTAAKQVAEIADPGERSFYSGLAKVATGNHALLTTAERKAIQGRKTAAGADYFAPVTMPDGRTVETITPEARAESLMNMPAIGRLIQTTESDALVAQQLGVTATAEPAPATIDPNAAVSGLSGPNVERVPSTPEIRSRAESIAAQVVESVKQSAPGITDRVNIYDNASAESVTGGVSQTYADGQQVIDIHPNDIEQLIIASPGVDDATLIKSLADTVSLHETTHIAQRAEALAEGKALGMVGDESSIIRRVFELRHDRIAADSPGVHQIAMELYARNFSAGEDFRNWTTLEKWAQQAETERMLIEAALEGRTTDVNRFLSAASKAIRDMLLKIVEGVVTLIQSGKADVIINGKKLSVTVSDELRARADTVAEMVKSLQQTGSIPTNAPANDNTNTADPADRQQQPAPGETGAGNSQQAEADSNGPAPVDGGTEPAPSPDAGASGFQPPSAELTAARKVTTEAFRRAIETKPILKKDPDLMREVSDVAFTLADQIVGMSPAEQKRAAEAAINSFLLGPEIATRVSELYAEEKAKAQAYRAAARARLRAEARRIITQKLEAINHLISNVGRITRPPNALSMIAAGETLPEEYKAALRVSEFTGGGKNAVVREIINMIWAADDQSGSSPDSAAKGMEMPSGKYANLTADDMWQIFQKEIRGYLAGTETANDIYDPDAELTDDQVDAALAKMEADQTVDKWREITGRQNLMRGEALRMEDAYQRIVRDELGGVEPDDFTADDIYARAVEETKPAQKPAASQPAKPAAKPKVSNDTEAPIEDDGSIFAAIELGNEVVTTPTEQDQQAAEKWVNSMPGFQGGKRPMAAPVTAAVRAAFSPEKRASFRTIVDFFGGGGSWGLFHAMTNFGNVNRVIVYERNADRLLKIKLFHEKGNLVAEMLRQKNVQDILSNAASKMRQSGTKSGSALAKRIDTTGISDPLLLGLFQSIRDYAENSYAGATDETGEQTPEQKIATSIRIVGEQAADAYRMAEAFRQRGGKVEYRNADSYQAAAEQGTDVLSIIDPPYYRTKGYTFVESVPDMTSGQITETVKENIVKEDTYRLTRDLIQRAASAGNAMIYTDSAYWKMEETEKRGKKTITHPPYFGMPLQHRQYYLPEGRRILSDIVDLFDSFGVVAGEIGAGRKEILGIHGHDITTQPGRRTRAQRDARNNEGQRSPDGRDDQSGGGGDNPRKAVPGMAEGTAGETGTLRSEPGDPLNDRLASAPIDPKNAFGEWGASLKEDGIVIGYRGHNGNGKPDNNFGSSEGVGLYIAKEMEDAEFFGKARQVSFPEPKRPIIVDEDAGADTIPMLNEEADDLWNHIFSHKPSAKDSDWIKAHVLAAKNIGLTEDTWAEKSDHLPRALTDVLLQMGYDAVYVRSGGMEWVNILAKEGQRFDRGTRSETGAALYSAPTANPTAESEVDPSPESVAQAAKEFRQAAASIRPDIKVVESSDYYQQAAGWFDPDVPDTIFFNPKTIAWGFTKRQDLLKKGAFVIAQEEIIHLESVEALGYDGVANVARSLNQQDRLFLAREYAGVEDGTPTENQQNLMDSLLKDEAWLGAEALRMIKQILDQGYTSETITNLADKPPSFVESVLRYLKNILRRISASRAIKDAPESLRSAVIEIEKARANKTTTQKRQTGSIFKSAPRYPSNPAAQYRYLKAKQEKAGLTPAEQQALLRAEQAMGQSFAFDMDRRKLSAPRGSVTPRFQPFLQLERQTATPPEQQLSLFSPATATQQAVEAALKNLPPLYREVFQASIDDPNLTPEDLGRRFGIPARGAENIINQIRTRIRGNVEASTGDLAPKGNSGRPDLGYSTVPSLQRIDQIRAQEGLPLQQTTEEIRSQAEAFLRNPGGTRSLIDTTEDWTAVQTAAANIELVNRALQGRNDIETAELAAAYREQGSRWSETGRARQDVHRSPAERHAMILADLLSTPDASTASGLKKAKTKADRDAILAGWVARVKGIKEHLLGRGVDIDEALQRLNQQIADAKAAESEASASHQQLVTALQQQLDEARINLKQAEQAAQDATDSAMKAKAEAEAAHAAQRVAEAEQATQQAQELDPSNTIRLELRKLSIQHRAVVESMRDGATWEQAAATTGLTVEECRRVMQGFIGALRQAAIKTLTLAEDMLLGNTLASPALNAPAPENRQQRLGRMADAMIGAMGYDMGAFDKRSNPAAAKTGKAKRTAETKQAKPEPAMMSDEEFTRRQNNPDTHRALWQFESSLTRPSSRISFDEWMKRPETAARIERQTRMWQQPVSTTTGTLDMHDVKSVAAVRRELHASRAGLFDKVLEFWRQSILSGPQTAIVNTGSNIANSLYHLGPRRLIEAGVNDVLGILGQGNKDAATLGEIAAMTRYIHKALARAGRNMVMAWNNETRIAEYQFLALAQQTDFAGMKEDYIPPAIGGKFGTLMRSISFRHMTAADEFIKAFHGHLEAAAQAHRIAKQEGLSGAAYEARLTALMKEGSEAWSRALAVAEDVTFQRKLNTKDPRALAVLDKIASATKRASTRHKTLSFFFPFVNTPTNIFKTAIEMSPVGGLLAVIDGARALKIRVARGNMTKEQARIEASELYDSARFVQDTTNQLIAAAVFWALSGLVDYGDDDESGLPRITGTTDWKSTRKGERDNQYRTMPPQSIRLGDGTIVSYSRIEPFATVLAGVVDLIHEMNVAGGLNEKALSAYMGRIQNQLDDKTFLAGVSDLINAYHDTERFSAKLAGNIVTGFVPNLIRQPIREADPYVRDTKPREEDGFLNAIGKQVGYTLAPGYAPPMLDVWGNPVTRHQGIQIGGPQTDIIIRVFDPSNVSIGKQIDPVDRYIFNWNRTTDVKNHLALEPIRDSLQVTIDGKPVKIPLTADEQAAANRAAGQAARRFLGDQWDWKAPTQEGIDRIKEVVQRFQNIERDKLRARKLRDMK